MSENKEHQRSRTEYQIRIDGKPVYYPNMMCKEALSTWAKVCKDNPECYVDIVRIDTTIIVSQFEYNQMKTHFNERT